MTDKVFGEQLTHLPFPGMRSLNCPTRTPQAPPSLAPQAPHNKPCTRALHADLTTLCISNADPSAFDVGSVLWELWGPNRAQLQRLTHLELRQARFTVNDAANVAATLPALT